MKSTGNSAAFYHAGQLHRQLLRSSAADPTWRDRSIRALRDPAAILKGTAAQRVVRSRDPAQDGLLFKFYSDRGLLARWRPSRARRAWAAARTALSLGAPVVEVVGFVEREPALAPFSSCLVMREIRGGLTLREWIRKNHRTFDAAQWEYWRKTIWAHWLSLSRCGVYHDDTKALNILLAAGADPGAWRPIWIDPESMHPGRRPGQREIVRNLVQLNGSLRSWVPEQVRLDFLREAAQEFPDLARPEIEARIREWTRRRLLHEKETRCGP